MQNSKCKKPFCWKFKLDQTGQIQTGLFDIVRNLFDIVRKLKIYFV